jgi:hypothetical protein
MVDANVNWRRLLFIPHEPLADANCPACRRGFGGASVVFVQVLAAVCLALGAGGPSAASGSDSSNVLARSDLLPSSQGSAAATFLTTRVRDLQGQMVAPVKADGRKATVLFFVMHECPVANGYAPEINRLRTEYAARGVTSLVVYVESDLTPKQARAHARAYGYQQATLHDPDHLLVKAASVTVSPEAAVISPAGAVVYRGRIDDRVADFGKRRVEPTRRDLRQVLEAIVTDKPVPIAQTKAVGCYIPERSESRVPAVRP